MNGSGISNLFIIVVIALIISRIMYKRIKYGIRGRSFKTFRLFTTPAIYLVLLIFFMAAFIGNEGYILIVLLLCLAGLVPGMIYGEHVSFFEKNGEIFYKRSPYILIFWAAGFLVRIVLEVIYPGNLTILFIVDALLAVTLGLIIGEAIKTYMKYREYMEENSLLMV